MTAHGRCSAACVIFGLPVPSDAAAPNPQRRSHDGQNARPSRRMEALCIHYWRGVPVGRYIFDYI